jgi:hypothetical protein
MAENKERMDAKGINYDAQRKNMKGMEDIQKEEVKYRHNSVFFPVF